MGNSVDGLCCGCTACINICPTGAIVLERNAKGFYSAKVSHEKCLNCGKCRHVCIALSERKHQQVQREVYAVQTMDYAMRMRSQSGGAYAVLAESFLNKQGILYGAAYQDGRAFYAKVKEKENIDALKGSKYIQADMGSSFKQIEIDLTDGRSVLFAGTPCYVDGLKGYLKAVNVSAVNLYTIDLVCHGVPSPGIFEEYLGLLSGLHHGTVTSFNFRDKLFGWREHVCSCYIHKRQYFTRDFVNIFYSSLCLNELCYVCPYSNMERCGDITLGDYWGIEHVCREMSDDLGTSLVIVNSEKGKELFEQSKSRILYRQTSVNECSQPNLRKPTEKPVLYDEFWGAYDREGILSAVRTYCRYQQAEEDFEELLGWKLYRQLFDFLHREGIEEIFLYGIGLTMSRILQFMENFHIDIKIAGLLDGHRNHAGKKYFGHLVLDEQELDGRAGVVVLCTRNKENVLAVSHRLASRDVYKDMKFVDITKSVLQSLK